MKRGYPSDDSDSESSASSVRKPAAAGRPRRGKQQALEFTRERDGVRTNILVPLDEPEPQAEAPEERIPLADINEARGHTSHVCWGCRYFHKPEDPVKHADLMRLWNWVEQHRRDKDQGEFFRLLNQRFNTFVRDPRLKVGMDVIEWPVELIRAHFNEHSLEPLNMHRGLIRDAHNIVQTIKKRIFTKGPDGQEWCDPVQYKLYESAAKRLEALMMKDPSKFPGT